MDKCFEIESYINELKEIPSELAKWLYLDRLLAKEAVLLPVTAELVRNYFQLAAYLDYRYRQLVPNLERELEVVLITLEGTTRTLDVWLALYSLLQAKDVGARDYQVEELKSYLDFYLKSIRPKLCDLIAMRT